MLYFAVYHLDADAGLMITGSHNPPDYNGFKMMMGKKSFFGEEIQKLGAIAAKGDWANGQGKVEQKDMLDAYVARLAEGREARQASSRSPGIPATARSACRSAPCVDKLPGEHFVLNEKVDGTFPAHHPDPTVPKNLEQLMAEVKKQGCDLGIAFDGDGDRIGAVDGKGRVLWGDQLLVLLVARRAARAIPAPPSSPTSRRARCCSTRSPGAGGKPLMWQDRPFADQEQDGRDRRAARRRDERPHLLRRHAATASTTRSIAALRLLDIVANGKESLAEMRDGLPQLVNTPELRFDCADERKFGVVEEVKARLQDGGRQRHRHRRRARQHRGRLVAAARLEHPGRAGGALRGAPTRRGCSGS